MQKVVGWLVTLKAFDRENLFEKQLGKKHQKKRILKF
jgi:hypothetical protein